MENGNFNNIETWVLDTIGTNLKDILTLSTINSNVKIDDILLSKICASLDKIIKQSNYSLIFVVISRSDNSMNIPN